MEFLESSPIPKKDHIRSLEGMNSELSKLGNHLITRFHVLMRISQIYDSKNVALNQFIKESIQVINTFIQREGSLSIKILKDDIFLNEQRLRYSVEGFNSFRYIMSQWKKRFIGEVVFKEPIDERTLKEFIYIIVSLEEGHEDNSNIFSERLFKQNIFSIEIHPLEAVEGEDGAIALKREDYKKVAKRVFFESIGTIKEIITNIKGKEKSDVRKLKRLVRKAVSLVMEDESILLGMTAIKNYDEYTFNHSVNVSIYSMAMGKRLGFGRKILTELGITAMLHDIGKSKIPIEVLNKPGKLNEEEWSMMKKHPLYGVEILLNLKQLGEINPKMVIAIFDHHLKNDQTGYPRLFRKRKISLFAKIIQIADAYDAMTTSRVYKKNPFTPEQALAVMLGENGGHFDRTLLKVFIGLVGIYPVGSLVLLDTHELGIVYKANPEPQWMDRPQVILVERDEHGKGRKELVDLTERDEAGCFKRSVIKTLNPNLYHVDIMKYFL